MALAAHDDLLVPEVGSSSVLRFAHASLPATADLPGRPALRLGGRQGPDLRLLRGE